jgi:hypothetical protein
LTLRAKPVYASALRLGGKRAMRRNIILWLSPLLLLGACSPGAAPDRPPATPTQPVAAPPDPPPSARATERLEPVSLSEDQEEIVAEGIREDENGNAAVHVSGLKAGRTSKGVTEICGQIIVTDENGKYGGVLLPFVGTMSIDDYGRDYFTTIVVATDSDAARVVREQCNSKGIGT